MNRISRFIYAALVVFSAVACHTSEIDNPNKDNPDKPEISDNIQLTASIKQTRVEYSINGEKLEQRWTVGDAIYGFYGGDIANKIVFSVESVDEDTGVASLKPESGWSGFLSAFKANSSLSVGLVYTGCTTSEIPEDFLNDGTIEVDMTSQGTDRIPACMHANNFSSRTEDDVTYVTFLFENDCSIIEVFSFSGVAEDYDTYLVGDSAGLDSIEVDGLIEGCKYSLDNDGKLQFEAIDKTEGADVPTTVTLGGSWSVTKYGDITYGDNIKPVYIAAVPFENKDFTVTAKLTDGKEDISQDFEEKSFVGGNSYYIMATPVVAKTTDNAYFKSVYDAFVHAEYLNDNDLLGGRTNTVTLLVDEIDGLGEQVDEPLYDKPIAIDYDVTLDINGCYLSLDVDESFIVQTTGELTIIDSQCDNEGGSGYIWSWTEEDNVPVIANSGKVSILNTEILAEYLTVDNKQSGVLEVDGSSIRSYSGISLKNAGETTIIDSKICSGDGNDFEYTTGDYVIKNEGNCSLKIINSTIEFSSQSSNLENYQIATIYFYNDQYGEDNEASFTMMGGEVQGGDFDENPKERSSSDAIQLNGNVKAEIKGDAVVNSYSHNAVSISDGGKLTISGGTVSSNSACALKIENSKCTLSGGTISTNSPTDPAVYCSSSTAGDTPDLTIKWKDADKEVGPLIVSSDENQSNLGAVSTNNAKVEISGGYLYSRNGAFYSQSNGGSLSIIDAFYTTVGHSKMSDTPMTESQYYDFSQTSVKDVNAIFLYPTPKKYGDIDFYFRITPFTGGYLKPIDKQLL